MDDDRNGSIALVGRDQVLSRILFVEPLYLPNILDYERIIYALPVC